jgi:hypothetical protein
VNDTRCKVVKNVGVPQLLCAFDLLHAEAIVDSHAKPVEELNRRIEKLEEVMSKTMDFIHKDAPLSIYDKINGLYEESAKEADIRKRYYKLELAYLLTLLYASIRILSLTEEVKKYLKTRKKA